MLSFFPAILIAGLFGVVCLLFINFDSIILLGLGMLLYVCVYCVSMFYFGMNEYEKQLIRKPLLRIKKKK